VLAIESRVVTVLSGGAACLTIFHSQLLWHRGVRCGCADGARGHAAGFAGTRSGMAQGVARSRDRGVAQIVSGGAILAFMLRARSDSLAGAMWDDAAAASIVRKRAERIPRAFMLA